MTQIHVGCFVLQYQQWHPTRALNFYQCGCVCVWCFESPNQYTKEITQERDKGRFEKIWILLYGGKWGYGLKKRPFWSDEQPFNHWYKNQGKLLNDDGAWDFVGDVVASLWGRGWGYGSPWKMCHSYPFLLHKSNMIELVS